MAERGPGVTFVALIATTIWLGAAIFLALVVAPGVFAAAPSRAVAGEIIGRILPALFLMGILVGIAAVVLEARGGRSSQRVLRIAASLLVAGSCAIAQLGLAPRIARIREATGVAMDSLPAESPLRADFGRLHAMSVAWLGVAILAAASAVFLSWFGMRSAAEPKS